MWNILQIIIRIITRLITTATIVTTTAVAATITIEMKRFFDFFRINDKNKNDLNGDTQKCDSLWTQKQI